MKDYYTRVLFKQIHGEFHWVEEDPSRYCYSFSKPNENVNFTMEWLAKQCETASQRAPEVAKTIQVNIPVRDKQKRNIFDYMEEEKSCKFQENLLLEKESMTIEVNKKINNN